jgi:hypothetical protein
MWVMGRGRPGVALGMAILPAGMGTRRVPDPSGTGAGEEFSYFIHALLRHLIKELFLIKLT